jgi:hypothetical protein
LLIASMPIVAVSVVDRRSACERTSSWVVAHAAELPTDLESLSELPLPYRRAAFGTLSLEQKAAVWRAHLESRATDGDLTAEQQSYVKALAEKMTAELYAPTQDADLRRRAIGKEAKRVLGYKKAREIVAVLGPAVPRSPRSLLTLSVATGEWLRGWSAVAAKVNAGAAQEECGCEIGDDWCAPWPTSPSSECKKSNCNGSTWGCGTGWGGPCDGECTPVIDGL